MESHETDKSEANAQLNAAATSAEAQEQAAPFASRAVMAPPLNAGHEKPKWTDKWMVYLTGVTAFVALCSVWIFQGQLTEARKTTQHTVEAFRVDERARLGIEQAGNPKLLVPRSEKFGAVYTYELNLRNVGKTAARDVQVRVNPFTRADVSSADDPRFAQFNQKILRGEIPSAKDIPVNRAVPKVIAAAGFTTLPIDFSGQEPQQFSKGELVNFVIGRVNYADAFGVKHWLAFCLYVSNSGGRLQYCPEGNDEDNNPEVPPQ